jgi:predicted DNA-binding protein
MNRTTFTIDEATRRRLRRLAAERGVSMATIIREAIDEKVERLAPEPRSLGVGASGRSDTARRAGDERPEPRGWR